MRSFTMEMWKLSSLILLLGVILSIGSRGGVTGQSLVNGKNVTLFDLECEKTADCLPKVAEGQNVTCWANERCQCFNDEGKTTECELREAKVSNKVGGPCPCKIPNSRCQREQNICVCKSGYVNSFDKRRCIKATVPLGSQCEDNSQCVSFDRFSYCEPSNQSCNCLTNFTQLNDVCYSIVSLNQGCKNNSECQSHAEHSICKGRRCICDIGYVAKSDETQCMPIATLGSSCLETTQCMGILGVGSVCDSGKCVCDANHYPIPHDTDPTRYLCVRRIAIGDSCVEHNDCFTYHLSALEQPMECRHSECVCKPGFDADNSTNSCVKKNAARRVDSDAFIVFLGAIVAPLLTAGVRRYCSSTGTGSARN